MRNTINSTFNQYDVDKINPNVASALANNQEAIKHQLLKVRNFEQIKIINYILLTICFPNFSIENPATNMMAITATPIKTRIIGDPGSMATSQVAVPFIAVCELLFNDRA